MGREKGNLISLYILKCDSRNFKYHYYTNNLPNNDRFPKEDIRTRNLWPIIILYKKLIKYKKKSNNIGNPWNLIYKFHRVPTSLQYTICQTSLLFSIIDNLNCRNHQDCPKIKPIFPIIVSFFNCERFTFMCEAKLQANKYSPMKQNPRGYEARVFATQLSEQQHFPWLEIVSGDQIITNIMVGNECRLVLARSIHFHWKLPLRRLLPQHKRDEIQIKNETISPTPIRKIN